MRKTLFFALTVLMLSTTARASETLNVQGKKLTIVQKKNAGSFEVLKGCLKTNGREICFPIMKVGDYYSFLVFKREGNSLIPAFQEFKEIKGKTIDVSKIEKKIPDYLIVNPTGRETIYVFGDLMCPFCATRGIQELEKFAKEGKRVVIVPFPVHGELSVKAWSCALSEMAGGKNTLEVLKKYFGIYRSSKSVEDYRKKLNSVCPKNWRRYKSFVEEMIRNSEEAGVRYVPFVAREVGKGKAREIR